MEKNRALTQIDVELRGLAGLAQTMESSTNETLMALADLLGPAVDRLFELVETLEDSEE